MGVSERRQRGKKGGGVEKRVGTIKKFLMRQEPSCSDLVVVAGARRSIPWVRFVVAFLHSF